MSYTDILTIKGTVAANIQEKRSSLLSPFIVFIAALLYGGTAFSSGTKTHLAIYILFGYMHMIASQIGITLLLWAMCKLFRGTSSFIELFIAVGYTFLPYGILMALTTYCHPNTILSSPTLILICAAIFSYFIFLLARTLQLLEGFTQKKALSGIAIGLVFFISILYLFGY